MWILPFGHISMGKINLLPYIQLLIYVTSDSTLWFASVLKLAGQLDFLFPFFFLSFYLYWFPIPAIPYLFLSIIKIQIVKLTKLPVVHYSHVISLFSTH